MLDFELSKGRILAFVRRPGNVLRVEDLKEGDAVVLFREEQEELDVKGVLAVFVALDGEGAPIYRCARLDMSDQFLPEGEKFLPGEQWIPVSATGLARYMTFC